MKRELIFEIPNNDNYRVVCRYGYNNFINFAWFGHLQEKYFVKKYLFFGKKITKWHEIDKCWWSSEIESVDKLKEIALKLYEDNVMVRVRLDEEAMNLK